MALSPADFYAYSRATGAPVPEDPQERAQIAPEVAEFRRNQLKASEQGQQQGQNALATLAGIGAMALAGVGAYRLARGRPFKGSPSSATAPVQTIDIAREAERTGAVRRAATEGMPGSSRVVDEEYVPYRPDPKEFLSQPVAEARRQAATEALLQAAKERRGTYQLELGGEVSPTLQAIRSPEFGPNLTQVREQALGLVSPEAPSRPLSIAPDQLTLFNPRTYIEKTGAVAPVQDLTSVQQQQLPQVVNQKINAVESGEDQITGRYKTQLQRNEDLDLTQVEALESSQGDIRVAASQLPDGVPADQTLDVAELQRQRDLAKLDEYQLSRQAQLQSSFARGLGPARASRNLQMTESQLDAFNRLVAPSQEDALTYQRSEPRVAPLGSYVQPASKTSLRGTSGRPDLGIYGIEAGTTPGREVWGAGSVLTNKEVLTEGENPITRPQAYRPNLDLPQEQTPEGYTYSQAALERPTRVRSSRQPLVQELTPERLESVNVSEEVRRLQRTGGDVQGFLNAYKQKRGLL
jgi:hypothetical protein